MKPVEYDVYLCCRDAGRHGMASAVAAGMARLGFRVFVGGAARGTATGASNLQAIEQAPDFVLLSSPAAAEPGDDDPRRAEFAHAFRTGRNILVLADPADADPLASARPPGLPVLAPWQRIVYDPARSRESIALVGHRLLSSSDVEDRRLMRTAKRAFIAAGIVLAAAVALKAVPAAIQWWNRPTAPPPLPRFTTYWTAIGQRMENGQWTEFPVSDGATIAGGDRLRLVFGVGSDGFAYVVARDEQGGITLLYPGVTVRGASRVRAGGVYEAPEGGRWFTVDARSGLATIYLLAGHEPLENLEELAEESEGGGNPPDGLELLSSTLTGLLDGKHAVVPRPVRTRGGREIVDNLLPGLPPSGWPQALAGGSAASHPPAARTGLVSAAVEIRFRAGPQ